MYSRLPNIECYNAAAIRAFVRFTVLPNKAGVWLSGEPFWQRSFSRSLEYYAKYVCTPRNVTKRRNRIKAARAKGRHTKAEWLALCEEFHFACVQWGSKKNLQKDHINPVRDHEGSDAIENIQPLCRFCNISKRSEDNTNWVTIRRAEKKDLTTQAG
jgi:5-methylcytosine-specific restriction endonuclease McrA